MLNKLIQIVLIFLITCFKGSAQLKLTHTIKGNITPKSIVYNGAGLYFAQNMIYKHSITVYDTAYILKKTISDRINLEHYGFQGNSVKGGPVEAAFSHNGKYAWVSNYTMEGSGFNRPGCDNCTGSNFDPGYIYKINTTTLDITKVFKAGAVPKYVAISPNNKYALISNWTSSDLTIIDIEKDSVLTPIHIGRHPRGIVVDNVSKFAYITVMGSDKIARLNLSTWRVSYITNVGKAPRHLVISPDGKYLYCSINYLGKIVKIDLSQAVVIDEVYTGAAPRTMVKSPNGKWLYVVNYNSNSVSKVRTSDMTETEEVSTKQHPIGITLNWDRKEIWVACYSGYIQIFKDTDTTLYSNKIDLLAQFQNNTHSIEKLHTNNVASNRINGEKIENKTPENESPKVKQEGLPFVKLKFEKLNMIGKHSVPVENNFLANSFIIIGSFGVKQNALKLKEKMIKQGYNAVTMPSQVTGLTYTAISIKDNPTSELNHIKKTVTQAAWIYRPN